MACNEATFAPLQSSLTTPRAALRQAVLRQSWHAGPSNHRAQRLARPSGYSWQATESAAGPKKVLESIVAPAPITRVYISTGPFKCLQARQSEGECDVVFTPDPSMPSDFLTKWIDSVKFRASLLYARGQRVASGIF